MHQVIKNFYNAHRYGGKVGYHSNLNASGLVLAGARWYSPNLRRWASRDPIGYEGGENLYGYVEQNPLKYIDPTGEDAVENLVDGAVGFGNGITFGLLKYPRMLINRIFRGEWEDPIVEDSLYYQAGYAAGEVYGGIACGGVALRGVAELSRFERLRWLNQNRYLRIGKGRLGKRGPLSDNPRASRLSVGPNHSGLSRSRQKFRHIDLRMRPFD